MSRPAFDRARIQHLAKLSSLSLSDAEADALAHDVTTIVTYVEQLEAVDTSSVEATTKTAPAGWREDVVVPGLSREDALRGAPHATETGFAVPGFVPGASRTGKGG